MLKIRTFRKVQKLFLSHITGLVRFPQALTVADPRFSVSEGFAKISSVLVGAGGGGASMGELAKETRRWFMLNFYNKATLINLLGKL